MRMSYWMSRHRVPLMLVTLMTLYMSVAVLAYTVPTCNWVSFYGTEHMVSADDCWQCKGGLF